MGSSLSNFHKAASDDVLLGALRGRCVDLPGGGDLFLSVNAGAEKTRFTFHDGGEPMVLFLVGITVIPECEREFLVLRDKGGQIFGKEDHKGLHVLASNLRDMLCKVGVTRRDMNVIRGSFRDKRCYSPLKPGRPKMSDCTLGRGRGVSVDRPVSGGYRSSNRDFSKYPLVRSSGYRSSMRYPSDDRRADDGAHAHYMDRVLPPIPFDASDADVRSAPTRAPHDYQNQRTAASMATKVRFGSTVVLGHDDECAVITDPRKTRGPATPFSPPSALKYRERKVSLSSYGDDAIRDISRPWNDRGIPEDYSDRKRFGRPGSDGLIGPPVRRELKIGNRGCPAAISTGTKPQMSRLTSIDNESDDEEDYDDDIATVMF